MTPSLPGPRVHLAVEAPRPGDAVPVGRPAISWRVEATDAAWYPHGAELGWESDGDVTVARIGGDDRIRIAWPFGPLRARQEGRLRIRLTSPDGSVGDWSDPVTVVAGFLDDGEWDAEWIGHPAPDRHAHPALLRHAFTASGVVRATLYAAAVGSYQADLNGVDVDDHVLKPGWTPFDQRTVYDTTDVTALVRDGENTLTFRLAGTWATEHFGFRQNARPRYGDQPRLAAQLLLEHADGSTRWIRTGREWQGASGPITASGLYEGEHHDARLSPASRWAPVRVVEPDPIPEPRISPPVRRIQERPVAAILPSDEGAILLDFGQNLVGRLRIRVSGPRGTTLTLRHAEVLEDGGLGIRPLRRAVSTDTYTLAGTGTEVWEPEFTFHGFRFAEIRGWPGKFDPSAVTAVVVHSDMTRTGWFRTSHPLLQKLHDNVVWSLRGNFLSIPTDCPQRDERLGWTGDIQVFAPTAGFLYDVRSFLDSWLRDLRLEQDADGTVPFVVPDVLGLARPAAAWGDAAVIVPDVLERLFGDRDTLARQYPSARAWVDLCLRLAGPRRVWEGDFQFGDWLDPTAPPDRPGHAMTATGLVATAYLARSAGVLARAASIVGEEQDAARYRAASDEVRAAFVREYVTAAGRMVSDTPTAYALGIVFDLIPTETRAAAGVRLADLVRENGYRIATGFVGTPVILDALTATGHDHAAARLLLETGCPSWLYPVTKGATTIWERWDSMLPDGSINPGDMTSFNHYALGAVADWMHRELGGLTVLEPGARRVRIAPRPLPGIDDAEVVLDSASGRIEVAWRRDGQQIQVRATIPSGVEAETDGPRTLGAGIHHWTRAVVEPDPLGAVDLTSSLAQVMDDPAALAIVESTLAEHHPAAVEAMRAATRWTRGQTLAEVVFQYASPAIQREIGRRLAVLSASRTANRIEAPT
ncbi:alpha-L-rhamnosidase [Microbacterium sp. 5K110]|jgi:alpha-L-rhamnosidase|uniref:alpha-L-rhamnosidase n=1 Tax=unclassified Microbacterium TaxID=2609290 RepID=UPI0010FCE6B0|nr:alpha-L-rhamnosidase [Microbacterium sp. 5K110]TLF27690.1 alpha-L-rhamnosidase [Microbacterium sp. 5K110]